SLYLMGKDNQLRRFTFEQGAAEAARLNVGIPCVDLANSEQGIVAALAGKGALFVIDPNTLAVLREIPLEGVRRLAASPGSSTACAVSNAAFPVIDLQSGKLQNSVP